MQVSVIDIGNSKGIRLTKNLLEKYDIRDKVEMILEKGRIILRLLLSISIPLLAARFAKHDLVWSYRPTR